MQVELDTVLLATDGSNDAILAAASAAYIANKLHARLYVAHTWHPDTALAAYPGALSTYYAHLYERRARSTLAAQVDAVEALGGEVEEVRLLRGSPADTISDLSDELEPGLLVMGSKGRSSSNGGLVGGVCDSLTHDATCAVLVVRGEAQPPERVIIGDDGSADSAAAAMLAASIGRTFGAETVLIRGHRDPPEPVGGWSGADQRKIHAARLRQEEVLRRRALRLESLSGTRPEARLVRSEPASAIMDAACEGDSRRALVAVGRRAAAPSTRRRLGGVPAKLLQRARGPVLICPRTR